MSEDTWKERLAEMLISKQAGPTEMGDLMKVMLLGGGAVEAQGTKEKEPDDPRSQQLGEFDRLASGEFVPPALNPYIWAQAMRQSTRLSRCIRTYARNTVGLGWQIEPIHTVTPDTPEEERETIRAQTEILREFFAYPNNKMPFTEIMNLEKIDEEATGTGYIEIVRNNAGEISKVYHIPSTTVRRRIMLDPVTGMKDVYGYIQIRGTRKRYFKEFGDIAPMNAISGAWHQGDEAIPANQRATEIIQFAIYDPSTSYYGIPRYISSATAIAGNRQAAIRNVAFFENDAVPRMAIMISGGKLTPDSLQQVEDFIRGKGRGTDQAHRVMILQAEPYKIGFQQQGRTMVEMKPMTVGVTEDQSFSAYRKDNDEEIREAFGLAQIFFQAEGANRANAQVAREITNEQELEPDRLMKEYIINQTIAMDILLTSMKPGWRSDEQEDSEQIKKMRRQVKVRFRFARLKLTDPLDAARMDQIYASLGAMTPNELRESLGKPPYPKDYFFADKPISIALAELTARVALAISQKDEEKFPAEAGPGQGMGQMGGEVPFDIPGGGGGLEPAPGTEDWYNQPEPAPEESPSGEVPETDLQWTAIEGAKPEKSNTEKKILDSPLKGEVSSRKRVKRSFDINRALPLLSELLADARRLAHFNGGVDGNSAR
jgi:PBSX family phage portal protein